jgi:hypothetical protein
MATKRSLATLDGFFSPDQLAGSITPDRVQDVIFSLRPGFGRIALTAQAETSIASVNTWTKVAGTTALGPGAFTFAMPQNNRLQCDCPISSLLVASAAVTLTDGSQKEFELAFATGNGATPATIMPETVQGFRFGPGGGTTEVVLFGDLVQQPGDYLEVWVRNVTDDTNVTATRLYVRAQTFVL